MKKQEESLVLADEVVMNQIYYIRGTKVMLDKDLAVLYEVEVKQLKRQVNRNIERFPEDFMFQLTSEENDLLRCQFGTLKRGQHIKYLPYAFTEQGVSMLSSVLNSKQAISVNIQIIRIFTRIRKMLIDNTELRLIIEEVRKKTENNTKNIEVVFQYLDELLQQKESRLVRKQIGYKTPKKRK